MAMNMPPPILEVEDKLSSEGYIHAHTVTTPVAPPVSVQPPEDEVVIGEDPPLDHIDGHAVFWSTYDRVTSAYDLELLDGWNKSLDILLIFAGLFSAINTAFIMDSYKTLQPDPVETTNTLLRLLITHRNDNITLSASDLNPGGVKSSAVSINAIFFASLSFSLTAAFGAVTAKQWLTEYSNTGSVKALHHQGRDRQAKFKGLETWQFRFIIDLLPILLQISLLLFLVGLVEFLWELDWRVAAMQLAFTAAGIAVYVGTIIIGVIVPSSPFRTPLSKYMLRFGSITWRFMRAITRSVIDRLHSMALQRLYDEYCSPLLIWGQERIPQVLRFSLNPLPWSSETAVSNNTNADEASQWTSSEADAAECVIWLLEHSEHVDTTIAALHACLPLPSPLLVSLINEREGLRERILDFHMNLVQQIGLGNQKWEEWRDRMVVSTLALFHLFKSDYAFGNGADFFVSDDEIRIFLLGIYNSSIRVWFRIPSKPNPDLVKPLQLRIELTDTRQATVTNPLVVSVNQAHWLTEGITCKLLYDSDQDLIPKTKLDSKPFAEAIQMFQFLLANQPTFRDIGYVAMAIAALHWRIDSGSEVNHWGYSSVEDKQRFKQKITQIIQALDKSKEAPQSVAIALSLLDPSCPNQLSPLHDRLLRLSTTGWLSDSYLASVLLESYWKHLGDKRQALIVQALGRMATWLKLNTERADSLFRLIKYEISISDNRDKSTKDSLSPIIDSLASAADDDFFNSTILSEAGLLNNSIILAFRKDTWDLTRRLQHSAPSLIGRFPEIWAYLVDQTLERLVVAHQYKINIFTWSSFIFLHQLISTEAGLHWPTYFPSELVTEISDLKGIGFRFGWSERDQLTSLEEDVFSKAVLGESVLLSWRATHHMSQRGRLPSSWNDSKFFETSVANLVLDYCGYVKEQGFIGVDYDTLRRYFEAFLQNSEHGVGEPSDDKLPQTPEGKGEGSRTDGLNAETIWAASNALVNGVPKIEDQVPNDAQIRMRIEEALETLGRQDGPLSSAQT